MTITERVPTTTRSPEFNEVPPRYVAPSWSVVALARDVLFEDVMTKPFNIPDEV